jgi:membrane-bound lytic murein transglycosylase D
MNVRNWLGLVRIMGLIVIISFGWGCSHGTVKHTSNVDNDILMSRVDIKNPSHRESEYAQDNLPFGSLPLNDRIIDKPDEDFTDDRDSGESGDNQEILDRALAHCDHAQQLWENDKLEEALKALDEAYNCISEIEDDNENLDLLQQKDDLRFLISKRVLEIYSSRYTTVKGSHNAIPITINSHVEREIRSFQGRERKFFTNAYYRSGLYRPMIVTKLKEFGLPEELSWLPLIESGYKVRALSPARALGIWQFIPSTGYKFGLSRNKWKDERMDPEKATDAAIGYLKELHDMFGDWNTVLAGYNCGEGRVLRVIRQQKINYLDNFWDLYERLPRETARYVPRFLATLEIINNPEKYGFNFDKPQQPVKYEKVKITKRARLKDIARQLSISPKTIELLNPELRYKATPSTSYSLKVPVGMGETLLAKIDNVPQLNSRRAYASKKKRTYRKYAKGKTYIHKVRHGETIFSIAKRYNASVRSVKAANRIGRKNRIYVGQRLKIPGAKAVYAKSSSKIRKYRVRRGDSLWSVAKRYGTTTKEIMSLNNLKSKLLYKGQLLLIPHS